MLKSACPRTSTLILALVLGKAGLLLAQVTVCMCECDKVPHIPFFTGELDCLLCLQTCFEPSGGVVLVHTLTDCVGDMQ